MFRVRDTLSFCRNGTSIVQLNYRDLVLFAENIFFSLFFRSEGSVSNTVVALMKVQAAIRQFSGVGYDTYGKVKNAKTF